VKHSLERLSNDALRRDLKRVNARSNGITAELLEHIAEFDARRLYVEDGYPSMYAYCVGELHMSDDAAYKRIQAARAARKFPAIVEAVAEGRLHLSAICLLAAHLKPENSDELLAAATHRTKAQVEQLIADRFPRPDIPDQIRAVSVPMRAAQLAPGQVAGVCAMTTSLTLPPAEPSLGTVAPPALTREEPARVAPLAPQRFAMQLMIGQGAYDKLQQIRALLGHDGSADLASIVEQALGAYLAVLEKRKLGATTRPRRPRRPGAGSRHVPAHVKRAVWQRDQGRCTFVSRTGHRCSARSRLEFDHIEPFARGGEATVGGIRLRCRAHNQYDAERAFGAGFMREKREAAGRARGAAPNA
jgi:hypothetical protein